MTAPDISAVVFATAHPRLLHGCVQSVRRSAEQARRDGLSVELLIVLSLPSDAAEIWAEHHLEAEWERIRIADPDRGALRQAGAEAARGRLVSFVDAGDMWSQGWLSAAARQADTAGENALWRHEIALQAGPSYFGAEGFGVEVQPEILDDPLAALDATALVTTSFLAPRPMLETAPFPREDAARAWNDVDRWWLCDLLGAGVSLRAVRQTYLYQRSRKTASGRIGPTLLFRGRRP